MAGNSSLVQTGAVPWEQILDTSFVLEDGCWSTCGGGHCCKNAIPGVRFQLIANEGVNLLFLDQEYDYIRRKGRSHELLEGYPQAQHLTFEFGGDEPLRAVQIPCWLGGRCDGVVTKPLLCRIYPFLPVFDVEGRLDSLYPASIFEATDEVMGWQSACTIKRNRYDHYWEHWHEDEKRLALLRHPYLIFYLKCYSIFIDSFRRRLPENTTLAGRTGPDFWHAWEFEYLSGRLFDWPDIRARIHESYVEMRGIYGNFLANEANKK